MKKLVFPVFLLFFGVFVLAFSKQSVDSLNKSKSVVVAECRKCDSCVPDINGGERCTGCKPIACPKE